MNMTNYPSVYFSSAVGGPFPIFLAMALFKSNPSGTFGFSGNLTTDRRGVHFDVPPDRLATDRWCDKYRSVPAFVRLLTAASVTLSRDIRHTPISLVFLLRGVICYLLSRGYHACRHLSCRCLRHLLYEPALQSLGMADSVMMKDSKGRHAGNKLWGDGWGWSWFDADSPSKTTSTDSVVSLAA